MIPRIPAMQFSNSDMFQYMLHHASTVQLFYFVLVIFYDFRKLGSLFLLFYDLVKQGSYHDLLDRSTNIFFLTNMPLILG